LEVNFICRVQKFSLKLQKIVDAINAMLLIIELLRLLSLKIKKPYIFLKKLNAHKLKVWKKHSLNKNVFYAKEMGGLKFDILFRILLIFQFKETLSRICRTL